MQPFFKTHTQFIFFPQTNAVLSTLEEQSFAGFLPRCRYFPFLSFPNPKVHYFIETPVGKDIHLLTPNTARFDRDAGLHKSLSETLALRVSDLVNGPIQTNTKFCFNEAWVDLIWSASAQNDVEPYLRTRVPSGGAGSYRGTTIER